MKKITLLAELTCLNKLVNGKVVVINPINDTYTTFNRGTYTPEMPQEFNPEDYALLETQHYPVVIEATPRMKEEYLVNKIWREQCDNKLLKHRRLTKF